MSRPGVEVTSASAAPPLGVPTDTSVAFIVAEASMGPTDKPTRLNSLDQFGLTYGDRLPGTYGYDGCDAAFHEGVTTIYYQRLAGDDGAAASGDASAIAGDGATFAAASVGAWGDTVSVAITDAPAMQATASGDGPSKLLTFPQVRDAGDMFIAQVSVGGKAVQTSIPIANVDDLTTFLATGNYARVEGGVSGPILAAGTVALAGGSDGTPATADDLIEALAAIPKELGPGQVLAPGRTDSDSHAAILAHCAGTTDAGVNRIALLDGAAQDDYTALESKAGALRGAEEDRYGSLWAPWAVIPGLARGTFRQVPWSCIQAGICARNDALGNVNQASAGSWGRSLYAVDLTRTFTTDEMEQLLYAGVDTARFVYGTIEAYAFRTLVDPDGPRGDWVQLNHARLNMYIVASSDAVGEDLVFAQLDGRGHTIAKFNGRLSSMLLSLWNRDELFGDDPTEAYVVNTGSQVNTLDVIADGRMKAVLSVKMSPHAELVQIEIVKYPITVTLTA